MWNYTLKGLLNLLAAITLTIASPLLLLTAWFADLADDRMTFKDAILGNLGDCWKELVRLWTFESLRNS